MRAQHFAFPLALVLVVACGGETETDDGGSAASGGASGSGGNTAGSGGTTGGTGGEQADSDVEDADVDCEAVRQDLSELLVAAQACDPAIDEIQCEDVVQGLCCPEVVTRESDPATVAYLEAVAEAKSLGCDDICAVVDCAAPTGGACQPDPGTGMGSCEATW